jgi:hypothetical protein
MGQTQLPHYHNGSNSRLEGLVDSDSPLLSLSKVIEFLPMAAYAVRAPDGVIVWFNAAAAKLAGPGPRGSVVRSVWKSQISAVTEECLIHSAQIFSATQGSDFLNQWAVGIQIPGHLIWDAMFARAEQASYRFSYPRVEDRETSSADEMQKSCRSGQPKMFLHCSACKMVRVFSFAPIIQESSNLALFWAHRHFFSCLHPNFISH